MAVGHGGPPAPASPVVELATGGQFGRLSEQCHDCGALNDAHKGDVMPEIKGSCHCGEITYNANAEPLFTFVCHCTTCQKATGSAFGVMIALPAAAPTINGITRTYDFIGDSGKPKRHRFCVNTVPA